MECAIAPSGLPGWGCGKERTQVWGRYPLPLTGCVTINKLLDLSGPVSKRKQRHIPKMCYKLST